MFHELGHYLTAKMFNWNIERIDIYPLGGITRFNDKINKNAFEELLVTIMGPVFQILLTFLFVYFKLDNDVFNFSKVLLMFNLLPIVPLDGSKIISIIVYMLKPYKKVLELLIEISYITFLLVLYYMIIEKLSLFIIFVFILLIFKIEEERCNIICYFNKFLIERCLGNYLFKRSIIIHKIEDMYKYRNNYIVRNNVIIGEKDIIRLNLK
jgi:stage IV sporulation protein FB